MRFDIVTIFPKIFDSYLNESLVKRARMEKVIDVKIHNLRDFTSDRREKVDDRPFGGGPGMVLKFEPIYKAVRKLVSSKARKLVSRRKTRIILFSTRGHKLDSKTAKRLSKYDQLILICGRYEGVDERVAEHIADESLSIGDFILSGGELPALVLMESVSRYLPGFLGKEESLEEVKGSFPTFTRPEVFVVGKKKLAVPKVLLSGDHKKIKEWRKNSSRQAL